MGIQQQNRDVFAEFDECRVAAVQKDPDMPSRAQLTSKVPDILSWPKPAADNLALGEGNLAMHLYRYDPPWDTLGTLDAGHAVVCIESSA